jgi:beta-lactamase class A
MKAVFCILFLLGFSSTCVVAQKKDKKLHQEIEPLLKGFNGNIGVYVKDLRTGKTVAINADTIYPTASMVKIPILIGIMDKINRDELKFHDEIIYRDSLLYAGVDILGSFRDSQKIELSKVMMLMLTMSDNTASLWLQSLAGKGTRINELMDSLGYKYTRVNSRTPGREPDRNIFGWGQSTPREMADVLERIYNGEIVSKAASDRMLRGLNRNYFDHVSVSQIPPYATVFSKNGAVNQTRNEVVLVQGKKARYVFCVMSKNNKDISWKNENEAWVVTRKISKLLWEYFEPRDKWNPSADAAKFQ